MERKRLTFNEYEVAHEHFYRVLWLQLTLRCPLSCKHCSVFSSPKRAEALTQEEIIRAIDGFAALESADIVCLTGGEPFASEHLGSTLEYIRRKELRSYIITAAHWASTMDTARSALRQLQPISLMSISADRFHEPWVPVESVLNAARVALELGIEVNIATTSDPAGHDYLRKLHHALEPIRERISVYDTPLHEVGRSSEEHFQGTDTQLSAPCPFLGAPVVTADGSVCACCTPAETNLISQTRRGKEHALRLGTLRGADGNPIPAARERVQSDPLLAAIQNLGPRWVFERAVQAGILSSNSVSKPKKICDFCAPLTRDPHVAQQLRTILSEGDAAVMVAFASGASRRRRSLSQTLP